MDLKNKNRFRIAFDETDTHFFDQSRIFIIFVIIITFISTGGKMVIVCLAELREKERNTGNTEGKFFFIPDMMCKLWKGMVDDRIITKV